MIIHVDILRFTWFDGTTDGYEKILPSGITQNGLQLSRKPNFHLLFTVIAFDKMHDFIKSLLTLIDSCNIHCFDAKSNCKSSQKNWNLQVFKRIAYFCTSKPLKTKQLNNWKLTTDNDGRQTIRKSK